MFYQYVQQIFPKLDDILSGYGTWKWCPAKYGMGEHGRIHIANTSDSKDIIVGIVDSTERKPKRAAFRKDNELNSGNEDDDDGDNSGGEG